MNKKSLAKYLGESSEEKEREIWKAIIRQFQRLTDENKAEEKAVELQKIFWETLEAIRNIEYDGLTERLSKNDTVRYRITELRIKSVKKERPKGRIPKKLHKLTPYLPLIQNLKEKGLSNRETVEYLKRYHKIEVSESGLRKFLKQMSETGGSAPKTPAKGAK